MGVWQPGLFSRVRMNIFCDLSTGLSLRTGTNYHYNSAGAELFIDGKYGIHNPPPLVSGTANQ